uniref:histidine ammonia-lyase-like isoform X3 n=1 Tax=Pristiophorus japonicus TaxID=55135 RepID=UPI00398F1D85
MPSPNVSISPISFSRDPIPTTLAVKAASIVRGADSGLQRMAAASGSGGSRGAGAEAEVIQEQEAEREQLNTGMASRKHQEVQQYIYLDGNSLLTEQLVQLGKGAYKIKLTPDVERKVNKSRDLVEKITNQDQAVYGINTGFGIFARTRIPHDKLVELQENVIRSTAVGVGDSLSPERSRMLLALRINVLAKGYSGISLETLTQMIQAFNASCLSYVPEKGTVGASGDLAPLAHLALGLMGEGQMWSPKSGWADAKYVLQAHGLQPISLKAKEGVGMINGTQMITALGAEAVERAMAIARQADIIAALTLEVLKGTTRAFDSDIHDLRPHRGQVQVAARFRSLLNSDVHPSEIAASHRLCDRVQDAYTLRCCPQVHGVVNDTIAFVKGILVTEMNSVTDNPIVLAERGDIISGGNFHGEYPAKSLRTRYCATRHRLTPCPPALPLRTMSPWGDGLPGRH